MASRPTDATGLPEPLVQAAIAAARNEADPLAQVVALAPTAIAVLDGPEHRYSLVNPGYRRLARGKGELLGRTLAEVWPEAGPAIVRVLDAVFQTGEAFQAADQPFTVVRDHGPETIWLTFSFVPMRGLDGAVARILVMANEVSEHVRALREAEALAARLRASNELSAALSSAHTRAEVARAVFEKGLAVFGADAGALGLVAADDPRSVELVETHGYPVPLIESWRRFPLALDCPLTEAIRTARPVWTCSPREALARYPAWAPAVAGQPDRAWATLPLVVRGEALGALGLTYYAERAFGADDREGLASVADRCAQALDRARALEEARSRAAELEAVFEAVPAAVFMTRDLEGRTIRTNRAGQELLGIAPGANASLRSPGGPPSFLPVKDGRPVPLDEMPMQVATRLGREVRDFEYDILREDGTVRHVVANARPIVGPDGVRRGAVGAFADLTARRAAEDALRESEARLREVDRKRTEFLGVLSHELRNPLAPIRNALAVLDRAAPGSDPARRAREVLGRQTEHLVRLVDDLLDVTRITHGKVRLQRRRADLRELVRAACDDHRALLERAGCALRVDLPEAPLCVDVDPERLAQVLGNLLQNAAKFTPPGGRVAVEVARGPESAEVTVRDTGIGLSADDLARLFAPFSQAPQGLARTRGGLGLGLALVKGLVELHGGGVSARSDGPGRGATFTVRLPAAAGP